MPTEIAQKKREKLIFSDFSRSDSPKGEDLKVVLETAASKGKICSEYKKMEIIFKIVLWSYKQQLHS